ncbi:MAG: hypothetical protein V1886_03505 [archaeon]
MNTLKNKKAQVTIFVIISVLIVGSVGLFYYLRSMPTAVPAEFQPIENYFTGCIKEKLQEGSAMLGAQAGYIYPPSFEKGSSYMPFSSQLDFFGNAVPYWFYISGNNIARQQVPSIAEMQKQLAQYIQEEIAKCSFSDFELQGYSVARENAKASVSIKDSMISAEVDAGLVVSKGNTKAKLSRHRAEIKSNLGKFYNLAVKIYNQQQDELFLENYTIDVLSLYAPVSDVELNCAPKTWLKSGIMQDLQNAVSANIASLKLKGSYYSLADSRNKYFVVDNAARVSENINFMYSSSFPMRFEVSGDSEESDNGEMLIAKPIGMQQGLGILGFCYVQYHFVYDIAFPVLIQIFDESEFFQFPVLVVISKNMPRNAVLSEITQQQESELCKYKTTPVKVSTFDIGLEPVEADIKLKCFNEECEIGRTKISGATAELEGKFPQCVNGFIIASAAGYADAKLQFSTNQEGSAEIVMQPLYNLTLDVNAGGVPLSKDEQAFITFDSGDETESIMYPLQKTVQLKEGYYNISVQIFRQGKIEIASYKTQQCVKAPARGIAGFFGFQNEQCYDIELPAQTLSQVISGGGSRAEYLTASILANSRKMSITASYIQTPKSVDELQSAYILAEESGIDISFK